MKAGPEGGPRGGGRRRFGNLMDTDEDGEIGLTDCTAWQNCFRGPGE